MRSVSVLVQGIRGGGGSHMTAHLLSLNDFSSCSSRCLYQSSNSFLATSRHSFFFTSDSASTKHYGKLKCDNIRFSGKPFSCVISTISISIYLLLAGLRQTVRDTLNIRSSNLSFLVFLSVLPSIS